MKKKRRNPKEIIEQEKGDVEHSYIKFSGREPINVTLNQSKYHVQSDFKRVQELTKNSKKSYAKIHTHPTSLGKYGSAMPSGQDILSFLMNETVRVSVVVPQNKETNEVQGYFVLKKNLSSFKTPPKRSLFNFLKIFLRKTKEQSELIKMNELLKDSSNYNEVAMRRNPEYLSEELDKFAKKYQFSYRIVPAKGYEFDKNRLSFKKKDSKSLETKVVLIIGISSLAFSLIFLSSNITGNTISNLTTKTLSIIGAGLFVLGIVSFYFYFKNK